METEVLYFLLEYYRAPFLRAAILAVMPAISLLGITVLFERFFHLGERADMRLMMAGYTCAFVFVPVPIGFFVYEAILTALSALATLVLAWPALCGRSLSAADYAAS